MTSCLWLLFVSPRTVGLFSCTEALPSCSTNLVAHLFLSCVPHWSLGLLRAGTYLFCSSPFLQPHRIPHSWLGFNKYLSGLRSGGEMAMYRSHQELFKRLSYSMCPNVKNVQDVVSFINATDRILHLYIYILICLDISRANCERECAGGSGLREILFVSYTSVLCYLNTFAMNILKKFVCKNVY